MEKIAGIKNFMIHLPKGWAEKSRYLLKTEPTQAWKQFSHLGVCMMIMFLIITSLYNPSSHICTLLVR